MTDEEERLDWKAMAGAVFTLINSALSASLVTLPFAFKKGGTPILLQVCSGMSLQAVVAFYCWKKIALAFIPVLPSLFSSFLLDSPAPVVLLSILDFLASLHGIRCGKMWRMVGIL